MDQGLQTQGPLFIVGMNGSGTTMLADSLGRHPLLYSFNRETKVLPHFITALPGYGDLNDDRNFKRLWDDLRSIEPFRVGPRGEGVPVPGQWRESPRSIGAVTDAIMRHFAAQEGKARWCEKTPMHALHISRLAEHFPEATFIHVIRDGRDCAVSLHRRWHRSPGHIIYRWKNVVRRGHKQGKKLSGDRYLEVRYEDLTRSPEEWMRRICSFIDVEFHEAVLQSSQPWKGTQFCREAPGSDPSMPAQGLVPNSEKWRTYFTPKQLKQLERIAGQSLQELGYDTLYKCSDENPPGWKLKLWVYRDFVYEGLFLFWSVLTGKLDIPWWRFMARIHYAFKQRRTTGF